MRAEWIVALMIGDGIAGRSAGIFSCEELNGEVTRLHEINRPSVLFVHNRRGLQGVLSKKANHTCQAHAMSFTKLQPKGAARPLSVLACACINGGNV